jgi:hypothetical protein
MPRSSSPSSSHRSTPSRSLPPPKLWHQSPQPYTPPPMPSFTPPPVQVQSKTGLFQSMKEGVGLGIGSSIGHSIARSFGIGAPTVPTYSSPLGPAVGLPPNPEFTKCLEANKDKPQVCQPFLSKDKSPWKECMELNGYQAHTCSETY